MGQSRTASSDLLTPRCRHERLDACALIETVCAIGRKGLRAQTINLRGDPRFCERMCAGRMRLPAPAPRRMNTQEITAIGLAILSLASRSSRCVSALVSVQSLRVKSAVQLVSQVCPASMENACSHRNVVDVMSDHLCRTVISLPPYSSSE